MLITAARGSPLPADPPSPCRSLRPAPPPIASCLLRLMPKGDGRPPAGTHQGSMRVSADGTAPATPMAPPAGRPCCRAATEGTAARGRLTATETAVGATPPAALPATLRAHPERATADG